ncbi:MAG: YqaA family protein [Nitrospinota bacterium]
MIHTLIEWTVNWAQTDYGTYALFLIAFAESSFFPIPPDILLIALSIINPLIALFYATVCTVGSVTGGIFGYFLGLKGGKPILERFFSHEKIVLVHNYFERYEAWAIGIAAFTPIPYKVFTIAAGVFYINFKKFVFASILGRGGRFFIVAGLIQLFGAEIKYFIQNYFELFTILFFALLIGGFMLLKKLPIPGLSKGLER